MILTACIFLFLVYVAGMTAFFYFTGNLFCLGFKKPRPEAYQLTEDDREALEEYRRRKGL